MFLGQDEKNLFEAKTFKNGTFDSFSTKLKISFKVTWIERMNLGQNKSSGFYCPVRQ